MSFLEKVGLGPKKSPDVPVLGEKKRKKEEVSSFKYNIYVRVGIIAAFLIILFLSVPQPNFQQEANYQIGEPWRAEDLTAPFTFAIQKNDEQIEQERATISENTPPVYYRSSEVRIDINERFDLYFGEINSVLEAYESFTAESDTSSVQRQRQFIERINSSDLNLSDQDWLTLLEGGISISGLNQNLENIIQAILQDGIINKPKSELDNTQITLRDSQERTQQMINVANIRDGEQAGQYARYRLSQLYGDNLTQTGVKIFNQVIAANLIFQEEETRAQIAEALDGISTTQGAIGQGQIIIRKGDIITSEKYRILQSLAEARSQNATDLERWLKYGGDVLAVTAIIVIFFFYVYLYRRSIFKNNAMLLLVLLTMAGICVGSSLVYAFSDISLYIIPIAIAPIILTIIFDSRLGILATVTLALLVGLINNNNFEFVTATIVACSLGLFSVRDIKKRSQFFFTTPGIVFISYAVVIIGFSMSSFQGWEQLLNNLLLVGINTLFILFTYPLILLFEKSFNVTTDLTLIELTDTNLPLLNQLMTKAPGTFHHSLQVANLSEAAAGAIRANGLLCRVGSLYHDIGKMENPEYYTENQIVSNELENLKPRMSALVIKAHVSNGVKMAKDHNIPQLVIDFIETHHGRTVIKYFYKKAQEQSDADKDEIKIEDFRYDGPLPQTKENGIVMLADCTEAASRSMKNPNYQKLKNLIDKLVDNRIQEGELSETPLTFQDLSVIKKTFLNILVGIYHSRVEYAEDEKTPGDRSTSESSQKQKKKKKKKIPDKESTAESLNDYYNA